MTKGVVTDEEIDKFVRKHEYLLKEMDNTYSGLRDYKVTEEIMIKTEKCVNNFMKACLLIIDKFHYNF